jgi:hypothetical protein
MATAKRHRSARKGRQGVVRLSAAFLRMTQHGSASADLDPKGAPFGQRGRAPLLVNLPGDEVSFLIEMVVNLGVYRAELLQRLHAAKPLPRPFASPKRLVRILRPIVKAAADLLTIGVANLTHRR